MAGAWTWLLANATGAALAELTTASGKTISFPRNQHAEATCTISHLDDAATLLFNALESGIPTLRCYRDGVLRFNGYLAPFQEDLSETAQIQLVFRSPFARLSGDGPTRGRYTDNFIQASAKDAGAIAADLIRLYGGAGTVDAASDVFTNADGAVTVSEDSFCGLAIGTINTSADRDREYQYANVGESIVQLTEVLDGFDFEERFVAEDDTLAYFDVFAEQGSEKPAVRFEYGPDTIGNVRSIGRVTQPPINSVTLIGAYSLSSTKENDQSIATYGRWRQLETRSDLFTQDALDETAMAMLRPNPVKTIQVVPGYGLENCPRPWDDFWKGDTINVYGRRGAFTENVQVRVNEIRVAIDDNGFETAEIPDPQTPEEEAAIRATLQAEVVLEDG